MIWAGSGGLSSVPCLLEVSFCSVFQTCSREEAQPAHIGWEGLEEDMAAGGGTWGAGVGCGLGCRGALVQGALGVGALSAGALSGAGALVQ